MLTRRQFLRMSALVSSGLLIALDTKPGQTTMAGVMHGTAVHHPQAALPLFTEQLVVPPVVDLRNGSTFQGTMASGTHQFHQALPPTPTWGYGGASYLGPTCEVKRGTPVTITWTNNLGPHRLADAIDTTLHGAVASDVVAPRTAVHLHGGMSHQRAMAGRTRRSMSAHPLPTTTRTTKKLRRSGITTML